MSVSIQRIEFLETLGRGGFGAVYLAQVTRSDRFVQRLAIKIMSPEHRDHPDLVARQRDEARLLAQLNHDHIVKVVDMCEVHGRPALLMEYVEGVDGHTLRQQGPLPLAAALEIVQATASALDAAWNTPSTLTGQPLRVIHRDIKPSNLLISRHGGMKVLDFGVARADFDRESTTTSMQYGTARFMAPEQWLSGALSHTVDIYALGVCAFELLTGQKFQRLPLQPDRFHRALLDRIRLLDWKSQGDSVRSAVCSLLRQMLSYRPEDRPTASEVRDHCISVLSEVDGASLAEVARSRVPFLLEQTRATYRGTPLLSDFILSPANHGQTHEPFPSLDPHHLIEPNSKDTLSAPISDLPTRPRRLTQPSNHSFHRARYTWMVLVLLGGFMGWWMAQPNPASETVSAQHEAPRTPISNDEETPQDTPAPNSITASTVRPNVPFSGATHPDRPTTRAETQEANTPKESPLAHPSEPDQNASIGRTQTRSSLPVTAEPTPPKTAAVAIAEAPILVPFILNSDPWGVTVSINGKTWGTTPMTNRELAVGNHIVEFEYEGTVSTHEIQIMEGRDNHFRWVSTSQDLRVLQGSRP